MSYFEPLTLLSEIFSYLFKHIEDDFVDRINGRYSTVLFAFLGVIMTAHHYLEEPISCWAPAQFPHEWVAYTNKICWISNTYYVPMNENIPNENDNKKHMIAYYQWVSLVVFLQSACFMAPHIIWKKLYKDSGVPIRYVISSVRKGERSSTTNRLKCVKMVTEMLDRALTSHQEYRTGTCIRLKQKVAHHCFFICGKRYGNYLITSFLAVKVLYLVNAVGQLFMLNAFLGDKYYLYGIDVVGELIQGRNWTTSVRFPRVTLCDFQIRALGNKIHDHTVQCALPINLFNEKIFIFVWFWLLFISLTMVLSILSWLWTLFSQNRQQFINKYLKIMQRNFNKKGLVANKEFSEKYLRQDGIFVLRLIGKNTDDVALAEIIEGLWLLYRDDPNKNKYAKPRQDREDKKPLTVELDSPA